MAGRLRRQARRNARLQYAPARREIRRQRKETKQTYRVGVRQERQAARGIRAAAEEALRDVERDYRQSMAESRMANRIGGAGGVGVFAEADALSRRQTKRGIAQAMAAELADLEARGVRATEAAAYGTRALRGQRNATLSELAQERMQIAQDQGAFALSELNRLRSERADRRIDRANVRLDRRAQAETERHNLESEALARETEARLRRESRREGKGGGRGPETVHSQDIKREIIDARAQIEREINKGTPVAKIRKSAAKNGVQPTVFRAAYALARGQRLSGAQLRELRQMGVRVPRAWRSGSEPGGAYGLVRRSIDNAFG